jgi:hypothetical protein
MVGHVQELCALLGEALSILSERFPRFLLALAEVPRIARVDLSPLEISFEQLDKVGPVVDLVGRELFEPSSSGVGEEERELSDDGSIVSSGASQLACQPEVCQPQFWLGFAVVLGNAGRRLEWAWQWHAVDCPAKDSRAQRLGSHSVLVTVVTSATVGTVSLLLSVTVSTASMLINVMSSVTRSSIVDEALLNGHRLLASRWWLLMN